MIEKISRMILSIVSKKEDTEEQKEIMLFGITRIVEDVPKYIVLVIMALLLGIMKDLLIAMAVIAAYKTFTGGAHLHTNIGCLVATAVSLIICVYLPRLLVEFESILIPFYVFVYIFSVYVILVYVPADVPEIPVINKKRRKRDKIMSFVVLNLLYIISFVIIKIQSYIALIMVTILFIDTMTTRTIYRLFRNQYGYETYVPDELLMTE